METFSALLAICAGNSPQKGQCRGALMFSLICVWINDWINNRQAGDLRRYRAHSDVIVMQRKWGQSFSRPITSTVYAMFIPYSVATFPRKFSLWEYTCFSSGYLHVTYFISLVVSAQGTMGSLSGPGRLCYVRWSFKAHYMPLLVGVEFIPRDRGSLYEAWIALSSVWALYCL